MTLTYHSMENGNGAEKNEITASKIKQQSLHFFIINIEWLNEVNRQMCQWQKQIQIIVDEIDKCIKNYNDEALTLRSLSHRLGYSEFYTTRKFKNIMGMQYRDYLRLRKLAFALKDVRDSEKTLLDIAFDYGFSSHEAFTRAFKGTYGITPSEYRINP